MATFRHATPGSIVSSKRLIVSDAITGSGTTSFTIEQPANSVVDAVFVRVIDTITIDSGNVGVKVGTAAAGVQVVANDADSLIASGTSLPAGTVYSLAVVAAVKHQAIAQSGPSASVTTEARDLHFTVTASSAVTVNGKIEFSIAYRIFD